MSSTISQGSFTPTSCGSCSGYIYDDGYNWDGGEFYDDDSNNYEDYGDEDESMKDYEEGSSSTSWANQSQASTVASSGCNTPVTDPFSMSSMCSLFGGSTPSFSASSASFGSQTPTQGLPLRRGVRPCPGLPVSSSLAGRTPLMGKRSQHSHQCSCQRSTFTSSGLWNTSSPAGSFNGSVNSGQNLSQTSTSTSTTGTNTESQLSVFINNSNSTNGQKQASNGLKTAIPPPRPTSQIKYRTPESATDKNGNGMIKNLHVYNPNITIQMTPSTFSRFDKLFVRKQSSDGFGGNGSSN